MARKKDRPYNRRLNVSLLFGDEEPAQATTSAPLDQIALTSEQPRRYFAEDKMQGLMESIRKHGILQPLLVQERAGGGYELIAGERRYRAAQSLELESVPVIVCSLDDRDAWAVALVENLQREDLNPVEETKGILKLLGWKLELEVEAVKSLLYRMRDEVRGKVPHNVMGSEAVQELTQVFEGLGKLSWESFVINRLPLLNLSPDILAALESGQIAYTKGRAIAKIKDSQLRSELLAEAIEKNWSLSEIKERLKQLTQSASMSVSSPRSRLQQVTQKVARAKLWEEPKKWKQVESLLQKLEALVESTSPDL
jgi:ParB family chromosome partitioning protein